MCIRDGVYTLSVTFVCVCAVSYTHLDVYKRQEYFSWGPTCQQHWFYTCGSLGPKTPIPSYVLNNQSTTKRQIDGKAKR